MSDRTHHTPCVYLVEVPYAISASYWPTCAVKKRPVWPPAACPCIAYKAKGAEQRDKR